MNAPLQKICEQFIENRETIKKTLKMGSALIYPACANLFCARGMLAQEEKLLACRQLLKENTGMFSNFRSHLQVAVICMLSMEEKPEEKLTRALDAYEQMKKMFPATDYLVLAAMMLADREDLTEKIARGKEIYQRMRKEHPFLTSSEDSVFAILMAFSDKSDDALVADMEESYELLHQRFGKGNHVQAVSHVLALKEGDPRRKAERVCELFDEIQRFGGKYSKYYELPTLAALAMLGDNMKQTAADMMDVDAFLATQKGYGFWSLYGKKGRLMHAAMLVTDRYGSADTADAAALSGTLAMLIAQQMAACAAVNGAAAAASAVD